MIEDVEGAETNGRWVRRTPDSPHGRFGVCEPPVLKSTQSELETAWWYPVEIPDANVGDLWRCGVCQKLWIVGGSIYITWKEAGWLRRWWYRNR